MLRGHTRVTWLGVAALGWVVGCGGSDEAPAGNGAPAMTPDEFASRTASAVCDNLGPCCASLGFVYDSGECTRSLALFYRDDVVAAAERAGLTFDSEAASRCIEAAAEAARSCADLSDHLGSASCRAAFPGSKSQGETCYSDFECALPAYGEAFCRADSHTCVSVPRGLQGDLCFGTCTDLGGTSVCSSVGVPAGDVDCFTNDGLYCSRSEDVCTPLLPDGAACTQCDRCVESSYCHATSGVCVPRLTGGSTCTEDGECDAATYCEAEVCVPRKAEADSCTRHEECLVGACSAGRCTEQDPPMPHEVVCAGGRL